MTSALRRIAFAAGLARRRFGRLLGATSGIALALASALTVAASPAPAQDASAGARIYREGLLPDGKPLRGDRSGGQGVAERAAACVTCHRPSGLGTSEGRIVVPPIIGKYLFRAHATNVLDMSLPHVPGYNARREPYTDATLARAIRSGVDPNGRTLNYLMPRYELDHDAMSQLVGYLKGLGDGAVPGVSDDTLHFATIVTPDADPLERQGMLDVLERFFEDKNAFLRGGARPLKTNREIEYRVTRRWQLHVWQLTGAPEQWEQQLQAFYASQPVFAAISGLGRGTWAPVHRFCQRAGLPCLMPNVQLPVVSEQDFYPVYFSRGVLLEVDLMAARIAERGDAEAPRRIVQVYRRGDIGESAAMALRGAAPGGLPVEMKALPQDSADLASLADALKGVGVGDQLVLWLRPPDLASLPDAPAGAKVMISGEMADLERAPLPPSWRESSLLTYPFDLPLARRVRMNYPLSWFRIRKVPLVAERVQTDTYIACGILAETLTEMVDSFVRDYLIERVEVMLSHRQVNGYYPRLSLAPGQRFASKGGYLVRFNEPQGASIAAVGEWTTP